MQDKQIADDVKYIRSVMQKTYRQVKPETHSEIMAGLVCMTAYISIHFLVKHGLQKWIEPVYLSLIGFGLCYSIVTGFVVIRRQKKSGFIEVLGWQLGWITMIIMLPIIFWDRMGLFKNVFCEAGFIYAMGLSMVVSIFGILYTKEWLFGGIGIFVGTVVAFFVKDFASPLIILGVSTGAGIIVPAIITERKYSKWKKEAEQALEAKV